VIQKLLKHYIFLFIFALPFLISGCSSTSAELQIKKQMESMQQAINEKSLSDFMSYFAKDFLGNDSLSRTDLRSLIFFHFRHNRTISTLKWQADIEVKNLLAKVKVYVVLAGSNNKLPEKGRVYTIDSVWQNRNGEWLISSAKWKDTLLSM